MFQPDFAMFRISQYDCMQCFDEVLKLAERFVSICQKSGVVCFYNLPDSLLENALQYDIFASFDGIHLKNTQASLLESFNKANPTKSKKLGFSAHNKDDVLYALHQGAHYCTLSPIFATPNKGKALGIEALYSLSYALRQCTFALGGITSQKNIDTLSSIDGLQGFASIRYFL